MAIPHPRGLLFCAALALAPALAAQPDPPARVARLAQIDGAVTMVPANSESWDEATPNRPLISGDRIETGPDGRVAVEFDAGMAYLDGDGALQWTGLDDGSTRIELPVGSLRLDVEDADAPVEMRLPEHSFVVAEPGAFRFDADPEAGESTITVYAGTGTVYDADGQARLLSSGRTYRFASQGVQYTAQRLPRADAFDHWVADLGDYRTNSISRGYVAPGVVGYRDLDTFGDWESAEDYGPVWYPRRVDSDWAPYRHGHWSWVAPWGWTWVDDAPWGFAPFHYGRWVHVHRRWGWVPGPRHHRAHYAPALVGFGRPAHGHHHHHAPVAWFPLGPRDVYRPGYAASDEHYYRVNESASRWHDRRELRAVRHRRDGAEHYSHARDAQALTQADDQDFRPGAGRRRGARAANPAALGSLTLRADPGIPRPADVAPRRGMRPDRVEKSTPAARLERPAWGPRDGARPQSEPARGQYRKERQNAPGNPQARVPAATPSAAPQNHAADQYKPSRNSGPGVRSPLPAAIPNSSSPRQPSAGQHGGMRVPSWERPQARGERHERGNHSRDRDTGLGQARPQGEIRMDRTRRDGAVGPQWSRRTPPASDSPAGHPEAPRGARGGGGELSRSDARRPEGVANRSLGQPEVRADRSQARPARGASGEHRRDGGGRGNRDLGSPEPGTSAQRLR